MHSLLCVSPNPQVLGSNRWAPSPTLLPHPPHPPLSLDLSLLPHYLAQILKHQSFHQNLEVKWELINIRDSFSALLYLAMETHLLALADMLFSNCEYTLK